MNKIEEKSRFSCTLRNDLKKYLRIKAINENKTINKVLNEIIDEYKKNDFENNELK